MISFEMSCIYHQNLHYISSRYLSSHKKWPCLDPTITKPKIRIIEYKNNKITVNMYEIVLFSFHNFLQSLLRYIYGLDPASQNDFFGIIIHEMPSPTRTNPKPIPLLRDVYALNHASFDKIIVSHASTIPKISPCFDGI